MATFTEVLGLLPTLRAQLGDAGTTDDVRATLVAMSDAEIFAVLTEVTETAQAVERLRLLASGVVAARSTRETGHAGLAQTRGHRTAVSLIQDVTGGSRAEAERTVRVGEALLADAAPQAGALAGDAASAAPPSTPWHAPLGRAVLEGALTPAQHDAIRRGLGEPPEQPDDGEQGADAAHVRDREPDRDSENAAVRELWTLAAEQLLTEAPHRTVEELRAAAKAVRDQLDPAGAEERFRKQLAQRSFRVWTDRDGVHHGHFVFDDEAMLWVRTLIDSALRPRRGGPRFVDSAEVARAQELVDDPRTNDQLTYDLMIDVLRAGTLADSENVFGARQAGVRIVRVVDTDEDGNDQPAPTAHSEDGIISLPGAVAERHICNSGTTTVTVDAFGNPLDVGREQRLFTPRQRIALAIRDGGCRWKSCDRPASYCEAHHIDPYSEGGRTDIDRGILLCRFHHMQLHHGGWRITRDGKGDFILHHPDGRGTVLHPRLALGYAWAGIDPPPRRFRPAAA